MQGADVLDLGRAERNGRKDDLATRLGGNAAKLEGLERKPRLVGGTGRVDILEQQEDVARAERAVLVCGSGLAGKVAKLRPIGVVKG